MTLTQSSAGEVLPLNVSRMRDDSPRPSGRQPLYLLPNGGRGSKPSAYQTAQMRVAAFTRDEFTCKGCGWRPDPVAEDWAGGSALFGVEPEQSADRPPVVRRLILGHIIPAPSGGPFTADNLRAECSRCNSAGAGKIQAGPNDHARRSA